MAHPPDNIPAGTQVVSSVPIHGSNDALVHPWGTAGIIMRTPTWSSLLLGGIIAAQRTRFSDDRVVLRSRPLRRQTPVMS
jgi:hypothetical protein